MMRWNWYHLEEGLKFVTNEFTETLAKRRNDPFLLPLTFSEDFALAIQELSKLSQGDRQKVQDRLKAQAADQRMKEWLK